MTKTLHSVRGAALFLAASLLAGATSLQADWTSQSLPALQYDFGSYRTENLADGRVLYATNDAISRQASGGGSFSLQSYSTAGTGSPWDPSSVSLYSDSLGAIGAGTFGPSPIYLFNPSNLATGFEAIPGLSLQNYTLAFRNASSLYVGGNNGTSGRHSINYVTLDGLTNQILIDNISTYSGDFAMDLAGNLYVSDNDDRKLYLFTAAQLTAAIGGAALGINDGLFLTTLAKNGSIAVDGLGRVWSAGYQSNGIDLFDPATGLTSTFTPGLDNSNYVVQTFTVGSESYVGFVNASGYEAGSTLTYGTARATDLVPEPTSSALLLASGLAVAARRRRSLR